MGNRAVREPTTGGDRGVWANYELPQNRINTGVITCKLYDDAGTLKLTKGKIGIYNGSTYAVIEIDTITTISIAGLTASRWAQVEAAISKTTVTLSITSIAAGTDRNVIPTQFTNAYDPEKGGYYINANKRCIGLVWIDSGNALDGIINVKPHIDGYYGHERNIKNSITDMIEITGDLTIPTGALYKKIIISSSGPAGDVTVTLPDREENLGLQLTIILENATHNGIVSGAGADTINSLSSGYLIRQSQQVTVFAGPDEWNIISGSIYDNDDYQEYTRTLLYRANDGKMFGFCEFEAGRIIYWIWSWIEGNGAQSDAACEYTLHRAITTEARNHTFSNNPGKNVTSEPTGPTDSDTTDSAFIHSIQTTQFPNTVEHRLYNGADAAISSSRYYMMSAQIVSEL